MSSRSSEWSTAEKASRKRDVIFRGFRFNARFCTIKELQKEKRKAEKKCNLKEVAVLCNKIGELYSRLGQYEDAISEHETELRLCEASLDDTLGCAVAHRRIGECLSELGKYQEALQHQEQYLDLSLKCDSVLEQQRAYATLGRIHYQHAEQSTDTLEVEKSLRQAEKAFKKSLDMCELLREATSDSELAEMKARIFMNLGLVYDSRNETRVCSDYFQKAIRIAEKHQLYEDMYRCQYNLSGIYQRIGNLNHAIRLVDMAIKCASVNMKDKLAEKEALILKAKVFLQLGDTSAAKKCLKKVLKMKLPTDKSDNAQLILRSAREMERLKEKLKTISVDDNAQLMTIYEKLGDAAAKMECFQVALDYYLNLERCASSQDLTAAARIPIYVSIAETYKDLHLYQSAIKYYAKELDCRRGDAEQECRTWLNIANIQELDGAEYSKINESFHFALQNAEKAEHRKLQALTLESLKIVQEKYGDKEGQEKTERDLERLCAEYNICLDDLSEQRADDKCDAEEEEDSASGQEEDGADDLDTSDSGCSTDNEEKGPRRKRSAQVKLNEKGETPLHRACIAGNLSRVKALVEQGHPINPRDYCGWLPLHEAANHGFVEIVDYLLSKGARIDDRGGDKCGGITPLHDACSCGNLPVVELLVEKGANLHARDDQGNTPLDSLVEYLHRSKEELTAEELNDTKTLEQILRQKMKGSSDRGFQRRKNLKASVTERNDDMLIIPSSKQRRQTIRRRRPSKDREVTSDVEVEPDSDDDAYIPLNPFCDDLRNLLDPSTASDAYRETISSLRGASHQKHPDVPRSLDNFLIPALIPESEMVGDDWLIDDVRHRKQKSSTIDDVYRTGNENRCTKRKTAEQDRRSQKKQRRRISDSMSVEEGSVSDSGDSCSFDRVSNFGLPDIVTDYASINDVLPTGSLSTAPDRAQEVLMQQSSSAPTLKLRLKVRIENNVVLVPVPQNDVQHTVLWLANEASDRYYQLYNLRPVLTLSLQDGAKLAPNDLVSSIFSNNEEVLGIVDRWDLPPLPVRYVNICLQLNCVVYANVKKQLLCNEHSSCVDLSGFCLCDLRFLPVSRALQYQFALKELNLEGNRLGDVGANHLWQVLNTLPNLMALNLSGNGLTELSLSNLATTLEGGTSLQQLQKLVLSYNSLGDGSAIYIASCLSNLRQLSHLYLNSCCLTVRFFEQEMMRLSQAFQGTSITRLEVKLNMIGSTGVELLLRSLASTKIQSLNLSNTVGLSQSCQLLRHLNQYLTSGNCILEELLLDGCDLKSEDVDDLCRLVVNCKSLRRLSISENRNLTKSDIEQILKLSTKSQLSHFIFENCAVSSPLPICFLDSLTIKLQHNVPLLEMRFTCSDLCQPDKDSLCEIWISQWSAHAICNFSHLNHVSLAVSDNV